MGNKAVKIYLYDLTTGEYLGERPSYHVLEEERGLNKNAVYDCLRKTGGRMPSQNLLISKTKLNGNTTSFTQTAKENEELPAMLLTEEEVRQKHDMFFMVISFVNKIPDRKFVEEGQMLRQLGLFGKPRYRDAISRPELKEYKGKVDGTTYYGSIESVRKLKQEGVLQ